MCAAPAMTRDGGRSTSDVLGGLEFLLPEKGLGTGLGQGNDPECVSRFRPSGIGLARTADARLLRCVVAMRTCMHAAPEARRAVSGGLFGLGDRRTNRVGHWDGARARSRVEFPHLLSESPSHIDHNQRPCPLLPSAKYHSQFVDRLPILVPHQLAQILMILASNYPLCRATSPTKIVPTAARLAVPLLVALREGAPAIAPIQIPVMRKTDNLRTNS
jgi:hypothetical protein